MAAFVDTSFYVAFISSRDARHAISLDLMKSGPSRMVTTHWIIVELGNFLAQTSNRALFASFVRDLRLDARTTIIPATDEVFDAGLDLYANRPDKHWSLTDCISFSIMRSQGLAEALTFDHHFRQASFETYPK